MLEELMDKRVIVVGTENHPKYKDLSRHYVGTLRASSESELKLEDWNDRIFVYYNTWHTQIGLDTRPTDKSKEIYIPREKVQHVHLLDASKLTGEYGRATTHDVFHLVTRN